MRKREPTERELEEQLLRHLAGAHDALDKLLRRKWAREAFAAKREAKVAPDEGQRV